MIVLGFDMGGTSIRAALIADGRVVGFGRASGGNFRSSGPDVSRHIATATELALDEASILASEVDAVCVGSAGAAAAGRAHVLQILETAFQGSDLPQPLLATDLDIAFRSASPSPHGTLLLAGTGAVAAQYRNWALAERADGMGWLLGDSGSGAWLGREVLRAVAAALDGRHAPTLLTDEVLRQLEIADAEDHRQALIGAATPLPPAHWGRFAPLALKLDQIDATATALLDRAAEHLMRTAEAVGAGKRVVYAGGLLEQGGIKDRLDMQFTSSVARFPVAGSCVFAAESVGCTLDVQNVVAQLQARTS